MRTFLMKTGLHNPKNQTHINNLRTQINEKKYMLV